MCAFIFMIMLGEKIFKRLFIQRTLVTYILYFMVLFLEKTAHNGTIYTVCLPF